MGSSSSKESQHTIYPSKQFLLPIFGHPFDVASIRLMGDFIGSDSHIFGVHILTPEACPISSGVSNHVLWDRFGVLDTATAVRSITTTAAASSSSSKPIPPKPDCYDLYGLGMKHDSYNSQRALTKFLTQYYYTDINPPRALIDRIQWDSCGPDPWNECNNYGFGYWGFRKPNIPELGIIQKRFAAANIHNIPFPLVFRPISFSTQPAELTGDPMTLPGVFSAHNSSKHTLWATIPLTMNGVMRDQWKRGYTPRIIVKKASMRIPFLKISFLNPRLYISNPLIYQLDFTINLNKTYSSPYEAPTIKNSYIHPKDVWLNKIWPLHIPTDPISTALIEANEHTLDTTKPKPALKSQGPNPICYAIRSTMGYSHPHFNPTQPGPDTNPTLGRNYYNTTLCEVDSKSPNLIAGFLDRKLDLVEPIVDKMTTTLGTILVVDMNSSSGAQPLDELERATLELIRGRGLDGATTTNNNNDSTTNNNNQHNNYHNDNDHVTELLSMPVFVILLSISGAYLDQEITSLADVQRRLVALGFSDLRFTKISPSPTRCIDRPNQTTEPLLSSMLHNGPVVGNCEALLSKLEWDTFAQSIHEHVYKVLLGERITGHS